MKVINQSINGHTLRVETTQRVNLVGYNDEGKTVISVTDNPSHWVPLPQVPWLHVEASFIGTVVADGWRRDFGGTEEGVCG